MSRKLFVPIVLLSLLLVISACTPAAPATVASVEEQEEAVAAVEAQAEETEAPMEEATEEAMTDGAYLPPAATAAAGVESQPQAPRPAPTGEPPEGVTFEDYGTNPFVQAADDNLSTFAVDVDTGSYTITRGYLNDGILPPPDAIRLEEFVNYFKQDYPLPQQDAFDVYFDAAPTPFSQQGTYVLRVGVQGFDIPRDARSDAMLIFVIDVSGSMDMDNRLGAVKQALDVLVNQLRPTDQVGIVVYGSQGRVLLEPTEVGQAGHIRAAVNSLSPDGSTNAEEGLRLAYEMATAHYDKDKINRLILCSDGVANVGETGPDAILETVRQQANEGITLTTVGFGMDNYNDVLMEQLANDGNGQYFYVDSPDEAKRIFVEKLTGTLQTIALDAKIQVEFDPQNVYAYRLMGYENRDVADEDFRNDVVDAGEIGAGHSVTALYEIVPTQSAQGAAATARLRWEDPETHEVIEIARTFNADAVSASFEETSPRFRLSVLAAAFADVLGEGAWAQSASLESILAAARPLAGELQGDPDVDEFINLLLRAIDLS